ncbi:MAG: MBL fold metallo-hydrolase [Dechloromonas sp.]|nr:MAG: MBL fold metallo-hydrolase [Dechloromonas sp.]
MKVRIHRGTKQIGGTCVEIEQAGHRIAVDFGLPLDGDAQDCSLVPRFNLNDLDAVVVSHPHIDHYGLLHHLAGNTPIAMGDAARRIVSAAVPFTGQPLPPLAGPSLISGRPIDLGVFRITPYLVDHSAFDAYSLLIESEGKRLFYSGDFRGHGRKGKLFERMLAQPPTEIDALLLEGSSLNRMEADDQFPSETELETELVDTIQKTPGLVMMHTSAQNIDRVVTLYRACRQTGRTLLIDLYTAAILEATGNANIPQSGWPGVALFVPESQRRLIKRNKWFDLLDRHKKHRVYVHGLKAVASKSVLLFRPLMMPDLESADALDEATLIYSQWLGYLESGTYRRMEDWLARHGIPVRYIHTSGHASPVDLKRFASALSPKALIPIHSFAPEKYAELFDNVVYRDDGEWWEV